MSLVINTNVSSLNAQRNLMNSQASMQTSLQRLSSGLRINSAKDDAAGLAISERMTAQIRGLGQAMRNANDGISMLQTAEGAMDEIGNMLQRMRELSVQAASDSVSDTDKASLQLEFTSLRTEIGRVANSTTYNNTHLLDGTAGTAGAVVLQVGHENDANNRITVNFADRRTLASAADDISTTAGAQGALDNLDTDIDAITSARAGLGAAQNTLESTVRNLANVMENQSAARSRIRDADFAAETANLTRTQILQQAGTAMLAQANQVPQIALSLLR